MSGRNPEDLSQKELLIEANRQLAVIIQLLSGGVEEREAQYRCEMCNDTVPEGELEKHLRDSHNAPTEGIDIEGQFEKVGP